MKQTANVFFSTFLLLGGAAHASLVNNGDFESTDFTGWDTFGSTDYNFVETDPQYVHSGDYAAFFGETGALGGISQQLGTDAGQTYTLTFWLGNMGGSIENAGSVSYFAVSIDDIVQPASLLDNKNASGLTRYDVSFIASSTRTDIKFVFRQDDAFWFMDDVSVDALPPSGGDTEVPEPGTLPLVIIALAACATIGSRRKSARGGRA